MGNAKMDRKKGALVQGLESMLAELWVLRTVVGLLVEKELQRNPDFRAEIAEHFDTICGVALVEKVGEDMDEALINTRKALHEFLNMYADPEEIVAPSTENSSIWQKWRRTFRR